MAYSGLTLVHKAGTAVPLGSAVIREPVQGIAQALQFAADELRRLEEQGVRGRRALAVIAGQLGHNRLSVVRQSYIHEVSSAETHPG